MFYYIKGQLTLLDPGFAVVDAGGVGYKLTITQTTYGTLPHRESNAEFPTVQLFTYMAVREDGIELFGFATPEELDAFKLLITVSGVGPKAAVSILSQLTPHRLTVAIYSDDKKAIAQANGIGPKTAARIILELKDKLKKTELTAVQTNTLEESVVTAGDVSDKVSDAQEALVALGYSKTEAYNVLKTIDTTNLEVDDLIRMALKKLMR